MFVVYQNKGDGDIQKWTGWIYTSTKWSQIVAGQFNDDNQTDLFFYGPGAGGEDQALGVFYYAEGAGKMTPADTHAGLGNEWKWVLPGAFSPRAQTDLLFFGRREDGDYGLAQLYRPLAADGDVHWEWFPDFSGPYHLIVPGDYLAGKLTGLFCYQD
jgi:hypothetical protein